MRCTGVLQFVFLGTEDSPGSKCQLIGMSEAAAPQLFFFGDVDDVAGQFKRLSDNVEAPPAISALDWGPEQALQWLCTICDEDSAHALGGLRMQLAPLRSAVESQGAAALSGALIVQALDSVRELKETFGLHTLASRLAFEKLVRRTFGSPASGPEPPTNPMQGTCGGLYDPAFLQATQALYDVHMGVENMGPLLYTLTRFLKPLHVLEVGAGYTSLYLLQALRDNHAELVQYQQLEDGGHAQVDGVPWCVEPYLEREAGHKGTLHAVDSMVHSHTTADKVEGAAQALGLSPYLELHEADGFSFASKVLAVQRPGLVLDFVWIDVGAAERLDEVVKEYWPHVNPNGGILAVHSTLTNTLSRSWLEDMRGHAHGTEANPAPAPTPLPVDGLTIPEGETMCDESGVEVCAKPAAMDRRWYQRFGGMETLSLLEPHKIFQNSVSLFQRRGQGYSEPIYTTFP